MDTKALEQARQGFVIFKDIPDSWQTRIQERLLLPFPLPWLLISLALFDLCFGWLYFNGMGKGLFTMYAMNCIIIAALTNSVVFFEKLLDDAADKYPRLLDENEVTANEWIKRWYRRMFWSHKNLVCGAIFAVAIPLIYPAHRELLNPDDPVTGLTYLLILTALGFASGSYFWVMLCIARMFLSLGKEVKIKPSIFDGKTSVLRGASAIIFKVSVVSALIYVLGLTTVRVCHLGYDVVSGAVTAGFGLFIVVYFVLSQWNIHKSLEEIKQARLNALVEKIDLTFDQVANDASEEAIKRLQDLLHLQGVVNGKQAWSFGTNHLLTLISTIVIPIALMFLKPILRELK